MRIVLNLLGTCFLLLFTCPAALLPQAQSAPSFLLRMRYLKMNLPQNSLRCILVSPDGRFRVEQTEDMPASSTQVFEDSLPQESLDSLRTILNSDDLKNLQGATLPPPISEGGIVWTFIPRGESVQELIFADVKGSPRGPERRIPAAMLPLLNWFQGAMKDIEHRKLKAVKHSKRTDCAVSQ